MAEEGGHAGWMSLESKFVEMGGNMIEPGSGANRMRQLLLAGRKTVGAWLGLGSDATAEVLARAGFDWLLIDMEHGLGDLASLVSQLRAIAGLGPVSIVRVPWNDPVWIKRILDAGAQGVVVPYVNDREEAEAAVDACLYPPGGRRGVARSTRAADQGRNPRHFELADDGILIIVQIETIEAVRKVDDILSVPRIDGIFVGPVDLSASMGHLGDRFHPEVRDAIDEVERAAKQAGKVLGTISSGWDEASDLYSRGYTMVTLMADGVSLAQLASQTVTRFAESFPNR